MAYLYSAVTVTMMLVYAAALGVICFLFFYGLMYSPTTALIILLSQAAQ